MFGFNELIGANLEKADFIQRILTDNFRNCGYSQISVPIVELASSFSEEVVGKSPWPEWNKKGCFYFEVDDYENNYDETPLTYKVLLVPEGTIPITRWLGESLDKSEITLPVKIFYYQKCFRNEILSTLSKTKGREFTQFGMEIMGSDNLMSEIETVRLIVYSLERIGIKLNTIHVRLNDVSIFNQLVKECGLDEKRIEIKELLDALAEVKAGKKPERKVDIINSLNGLLSSVPDNLMKKWDAVIKQNDYSIDNARLIFGELYLARFNRLELVQRAFAKFNINIELDLCVIRSHEYYTGISFEVDVCGSHEKCVEIAGGGRYDRLVGNFISSKNSPAIVPCVGFAFGMERLVELLDQEGLYSPDTVLSSVFKFDNGSGGGNQMVNDFLSSIEKTIQSNC